MKRCKYSFAVCFVMCLFFFAYTFSFAQVLVSITESNAHPGGPVLIPVHLSNGINIAGANATITFSPDVIQSPTFVGGELLMGHQVDYHSPAPAEFRFITYANPTSSFLPGAGNIGYIKGILSASATLASDVSVVISDASLGTQTGQRVGSVTIQNGVIHVIPASFTFGLDAEGWQFAGAVSSFDIPGSDDQGGHLMLTPDGSINAFSYWFSPDVQILDNKLYKIEWLVGSDSTAPDTAVQMRLRVNQKGSWQAWDSIVNSNLGQAPDQSSDKTYAQYINPDVIGTTDNKLVYSFDIMSFDWTDDINSSNYLESLVMTEASYTEATEIANYSFSSDSEGWSFVGNISPYDTALSLASSGVLGLNANGSSNCFSYWFSPDVTLTDDTLYRARFEVGSTTTTADTAVQFRLRVNQKGSWLGWDRIVNSNLDQAPTFSGNKNYDILFEPDVTGSSDDKAVLSFDIMSFDSTDDISSWLFLDSLSIREVTP